MSSLQSNVWIRTQCICTYMYSLTIKTAHYKLHRQMTVDITHDCIWILNADKHLRFLQSKPLQCTLTLGRETRGKEYISSSMTMYVCNQKYKNGIFIKKSKGDHIGNPSNCTTTLQMF